MHVLKQHLTVFVDLVYWSTLHFDIFSMKLSSHVGCPPSGAKKWQNMVTGVFYSCLLIELGPNCISMTAAL